MKNPVLAAILTVVAFPAARAADDIKLEYDSKLTSLGFPAPFVRGTMHGQSVWFMVDTGAAVHVIASWFVTAAQIKTRPTGTKAKGSTGAETRVRGTSGESIRVDATKQEIRLREAIVVDFPKIFEQQKIAGLISPQLLAPRNQAVILDLREPRISFGPIPEPTIGSRICRNPESPFENLLYAAPVTSDDVEGILLVDTGATSSIVSPSSTLGSTLASRAKPSAGKAQGVGGPTITTRIVPGALLKFGDGQAKLDLAIGKVEPTCGPAGQLGMDVLRQCRLVMGGATFAWSCGNN